MAIPQFGLVAEASREGESRLSRSRRRRESTTVRYEAVNAMLLNEFLKEHRKAQSAAAQD